jgi:hypothetical protein
MERGGTPKVGLVPSKTTAANKRTAANKKATKGVAPLSTYFNSMEIAKAFVGLFIVMQLFFFYKLENIPSRGFPASIGSSNQPAGKAVEGDTGQREIMLQPVDEHRNSTLEWPDLESIWHQGKMVGNPQFLLDFAIVGFEKCGTSTLMNWLGSHPQAQCFQEEVYDLYRNLTGAMIWRLYTGLEQGYQYRRGYKSPVDIFNMNVFHLLDQYFPNTKLLLTLRHPVLYFQSLYNFRIQNLENATGPFLDPTEAIGMCDPDAQGVCTDHAHFGKYMYRIGKTLAQSPITQTGKEILSDLRQYHPKSVKRIKYTRNPIFVMEMSQFTDKDANRKAQLTHDLSQFLGLTIDLDANAPHATPGRKWPPEIQAIKDTRKMHICEEKYAVLRAELMRISRQTATWIGESFLHSPDVHVSSADFFLSSLEAWMEDPCEMKQSA